MRIGSFEGLLVFTILVVSITVYAIIKIIESSNKQRQMRPNKQRQMRQQQQQVVVVQSNPVSQPLQNPSNVIHNVTYNIHDSAIAGDINVGLSEQDGRLNQ